jgi:hypothetical protein
MVDNHLNLRLYDMGLAMNDQWPDPVTAAGLAPQGNPQYLAPEQLWHDSINKIQKICCNILIFQQNMSLFSIYLIRPSHKRPKGRSQERHIYSGCDAVPGCGGKTSL